MTEVDKAAKAFEGFWSSQTAAWAALSVCHVGLFGMLVVLTSPSEATQTVFSYIVTTLIALRLVRL